MKNIVIIWLFLVLLTSCGQKVQDNNNTSGTPKAPVEDTPVSQAVKEFEMESFTEIIDEKYYPQFSLKEMRVKKWDKVKIMINTTQWTHDFKIDEFWVYAETPTGEVTTVEFTADKAGEFVYWCTKPDHRENGHWGTLIVEE